MKRYGMVIKIKKECLQEYIDLHASPAPELLDALEQSNIKNNTVFHIKDLLFNYFEYHGTDFASDWGKYARSPVFQKLLAKMKDFFEPFEAEFPKPGWSEMTPVFHKD